MAEPTLTDIFGAGATQTPTTITLLKSDLPMTAATVNRGEQVLAAIAKKASTVLTSATFDVDIDRSVAIQTGFDSLVYRTIATVTETLLQTQLVFNFTKPQITSGVTPDDY
jgi:hypothetical protein